MICRRLDLGNEVGVRRAAARVDEVGVGSFYGMGCDWSCTGMVGAKGDESEPKNAKYRSMRNQEIVPA